MKFPIGFRSEEPTTVSREHPEENKLITDTPVRSLVDVHFPAHNTTLPYYNDRFDLAPGDLVYVEGKLEGLHGYIVNVNRCFKIKLSDYKRIIAKADTSVRGQLSFCDSHAVAFDRDVIPYSKVITWFKAPDSADEEYVTGEDNTGFMLENLGSMNVRREVAERGHEYYTHSRVSYICLDGVHGRAIVEGSEPYELEFELINGEIRNLSCSCYCTYPCKHEFAAMLQLRETLDLIRKNYGDQYDQTGYFAAISKKALMSVVLNRAETGTICLN